MVAEVKKQPHSQDLEAYILGSCLISNDIIPIVLERVGEAAFRGIAHGHIFSVIKKRFRAGQFTDMVAVVEELKLIGKLEECGGAYGISKLTDKIRFIQGIEDKLDLLIEYQLQREAQSIGLNLVAKCMDHPGRDLLLDASKAITDAIDGTTKGELESIGDAMVRIITERDKQVEGELIGLDCGLGMINKQISGLCAPDLIIIAARPGAGKTAVMLNLAKQISVIDAIPGAIFSLEMSRYQLLNRLESMLSGVPFSKIRHNAMAETERESLAIADEMLANSKLVIDDSAGISITELRSKASVLKRKHDIKYLAVDYLQLMDGETKKGGNREQEISNISRGLKKLAKDLNIPVIALSQLSRAVEQRPNKMPQLSDLRESGAIEQDADVVMFLMRPEYYKITDPQTVEGVEYDTRGLIICEFAKNRHNMPTTIALGSSLGCFQVYDNAITI